LHEGGEGFVVTSPATAASAVASSVTGARADALLAPVTDIDGFVLGCLIDAATGMVLAARQNHAEISLPAAAAGAADIASTAALLTARLGSDDSLDDAILAFGKHFHVISPLAPNRPEPGHQREAGHQEPEVVLLVILDRQKTNLALARREIRDFCAGFAA
jgi:hypothetical protein